MVLRGGNEVVGTTLKSYEAFMNTLAAVQKQNMMLGVGWIEGSFRMLQMQAEFNMRTAEMMVEQARRQQGASRSLVEGSAGVFDEIPRVASTDGGERSLLVEEYDRLNVEEISTRLEKLDAREVEELRDHEWRHKNRGPVLERLDRALV